jgi:hypothetical protein
VQSGANEDVGAAATSLSASFSGPVTAGNTVIVAIQTGAHVTQVTDGRNTYALAVSAGSGTTVSIYYAANVAGGAQQIQVDFDVADGAVVCLQEFSGLATSSPLDQTSGQSGTGTAIDPGPLAAASREVVVGYGRSNAGVATTPGTGFALQECAAGNRTEYRIVSQTGTYNATFTSVSSSVWAAVAASFRPAN